MYSLNITSTMSDRAATQVKFSELSKTYRKEIVIEYMSTNRKKKS